MPSHPLFPVHRPRPTCSIWFSGFLYAVLASEAFLAGALVEATALRDTRRHDSCGLPCMRLYIVGWQIQGRREWAGWDGGCGFLACVVHFCVRGGLVGWFVVLVVLGRGLEIWGDGMCADVVMDDVPAVDCFDRIGYV